MQISKLLEISTTKYEDFYDIYEAVKNKNTWGKIRLNSSEKDKIEKVVRLVDEQTRDLMVTPLKTLKYESNRYTFHLENQYNCNYDYGYSYSCLSVKLSSPPKKRYAWICLYYEYLPTLAWGLGISISITELSKMRSLSQARKGLEKQIQKIIGKGWATTGETISYWKQIGLSEDDINEEIEEGGVIRFKKPIELTAGTKISEIHERIIKIVRSSFIQKIPELKKFCQRELL